MVHLPRVEVALRKTVRYRIEPKDGLRIKPPLGEQTTDVNDGTRRPLHVRLPSIFDQGRIERQSTGKILAVSRPNKVTDRGVADKKDLPEVNAHWYGKYKAGGDKAYFCANTAVLLMALTTTKRW